MSLPASTPVEAHGQKEPDSTNTAENIATSELPAQSAEAKGQQEAEEQKDDVPHTKSETEVGGAGREALNRSETADLFLGPDGAAPANAATESSEPILHITLMLTTGARHPYTISSKYLASRKVTATNEAGVFDPREISAYKLKELIWTDWRSEWEPRPADPAAIRLIILGRMLHDNSLLKGVQHNAENIVIGADLSPDSPFSLTNTNVVHMTVKPAELLDDDTEGAGKHTAQSVRRRGMSEGESAGCCRCVLQ